MRRTAIWVAALTLALAACSSAAETTEMFSEIGGALDGDGNTFYGGEEGAGETPRADSVDQTASSGELSFQIAVSADRKVIRDVALQLEADDTRDTYDEIVRVTELQGGFIASAEVNPSDDGEQPYVRVTVRIPSANLTAALDGFKEAAEEVVSESQGAQDVTESYIDLEAQLTNLTLLETELRSLLAEVREQPDADPEKLLRVFTEISNTRGEIERIQGQLNYLEDAVDLATVNVAIQPTPAAVPIVDEGWAPVETVRDASRDLVSGLQDLLDVIITFAIAVLPMLILTVAIPGLVAFFAYRAWRRRHPQTRVPATE